MNLIKECFVEDCSAFFEKLKSIGFSDYQTMKFLPEAASHISYATHKSGVFQTINCLMSGHDNQLSSTIDMPSMVNKSGINTDMLALGFHAIAPVLLQAYSKRIKGFTVSDSSHV